MEIFHLLFCFIQTLPDIKVEKGKRKLPAKTYNKVFPDFHRFHSSTFLHFYFPQHNKMNKIYKMNKMKRKKYLNLKCKFLIPEMYIYIVYNYVENIY